MIHYFAYGSNMDFEQMRERCPGSRYVGRGYLQDYTLGFTRMSSKWNSAVADILVSPGDRVWGIIYELSKENLSDLDTCEGHPKYYRRIAETVMKFNDKDKETRSMIESTGLGFEIVENAGTSNFTEIEVEVYEVVDKKSGLAPGLNYLHKMLDAAFENCFPKSYQELLHQFGKIDYEARLQHTIDALLDLQVLVDSRQFPSDVAKQKEWGGANLVVTGSKKRKSQLNRDYPHDLVVLTPHWRVLSWLIHKIYWDNQIAWQVDYTNKHYVLHEFGMAALEYQKEQPDDPTPRGICLAVLYRAYRIFTIDFYGKY